MTTPASCAMECVARVWVDFGVTEGGETRGELGSTTISGCIRVDRPPELFAADEVGLADGLTMNGLE